MSTPAFGVTSFTINPNTLTPITPGSSASSTNPESTPGFTTEFSLEAPVSVLTPAISSFSVTAIVNPLEDLGFIPTLGSVSDISAPGITAPGTVSTPSSGAGGITAPSDSSAGVPELPRVESPNGTVSSVIAPVGESTGGIKALGYGYDIFGKCVENGFFGTCTPSKDLLEKAKDLDKKIDQATGDEKDRLKAQAALLYAQVSLRDALGNDALADGYISRMEKSPYYQALKSNPLDQISFWGDVARLENGYDGTNRDSVKQAVEQLVRLSENTLPKRGPDGRISGANVIGGLTGLRAIAGSLAGPGILDAPTAGGLRILGGLFAQAGAALGALAGALLLSITLTGDSGQDPCYGKQADAAFSILQGTAEGALIPPLNGNRNPITGGATVFPDRTVATSIWAFNSEYGTGLAVSGTDVRPNGQRLFPNAVAPVVPSRFGFGGPNTKGGNEDHAEIKLLDYVSQGNPGPAVGAMYLYVTRQPCDNRTGGGCQRSVADFRAEYGDKGSGSQFRLCGTYGPNRRPF